jgi:hypothetical protein
MIGQSNVGSNHEVVTLVLVPWTWHPFLRIITGDPGTRLPREVQFGCGRSALGGRVGHCLGGNVFAVEAADRVLLNSC